jgi:hypothetical protein
MRPFSSTMVFVFSIYAKGLRAWRDHEAETLNEKLHSSAGVATWAIFAKPNKTFLVRFGWNEKCWYAVWQFGKCNLRSFCIFYCHLVHYPVWIFWTNKNLATRTLNNMPDQHKNYHTCKSFKLKTIKWSDTY